MPSAKKLILTCLGASASVWAARPPVARASSEFKWETEGKDVGIVIFSVDGTIHPATVWVHVDDRRDRDRANGGINLVNCVGASPKYVHRNQTAQCVVWPGRPLTASSKLNCEETGFVQVEVTGRSGDGGIDGKGIAKVNGILSFHVVFQCKRYQGAVSAGQVRDFRGGYGRAGGQGAAPDQHPVHRGRRTGDGDAACA